MRSGSRTVLVLVCAFEVVETAFATRGESPIVGVYERIAPSVVLISVQGMVVDAKTLSRETVQATGSGFAVRPGLVATNYHVIENARQIEVVLADERSAMASIVGTSPENDLALLRVPFDVNRLPPAEPGSAQGVRVGQAIVTVGNPLGLQHSVSAGVISGLHREIPGVVVGSTMIQFNAAINPGQSGGPLVDLAGRVIGMITAKAIQAEAIGFAVPIDLIERVIPDLERMGHPFRPRIGFDGTDIDPEIARLFELPAERGVLIEAVAEGSLAEEIGITAGARRFWRPATAESLSADPQARPSVGCGSAQRCSRRHSRAGSTPRCLTSGYRSVGILG